MTETVKQKIKRQRASGNPITRAFAAVAMVSWRLLKPVILACTDSDYRSILLLKLMHSGNVHQTTPLTSADRYPLVFSACRDYFDARRDLKILSFGCSTGEEVLTLRKYFPDAHIVGAEINRRSLAKCRKLSVDSKIRFIHSSQREIEPHGPFDAVFCMAVLQRTPHKIINKGIKNLEDIYPFGKYDQKVVELDNLVKQQGLFVVHFALYMFEDASIAGKYTGWGDFFEDHNMGPFFDRSSMLVENPSPSRSIFVKNSG